MTEPYSMGELEIIWQILGMHDIYYRAVIIKTGS